MGKKKKQKNLKNGFTLVEMVIAIALFSVIAIAAYGSFRSGFQAYQRIELTVGKEHEFNMLIRQMSQELRNAIYYADVPFQGESNSIRFPSRLWRYHDDKLEEDLYEVSYQFRGSALEKTEEKLRKTFAHHEVAKESLLALETCRFQYAYKNRTGGIEWKNEWGKNPYLGFPHAIRFTIKLSDKKRKEFERTIQFLIPHGVLGTVQ